MNAFDPSQLQPGDVLLYTASSMVGNIIEIKTGELFSHVEGYIGDGKSLGARITGINIYPTRIDRFLTCVRRIPSPGFNIDNALDRVRPLMGKPYDVGGLFSFFNPWAKNNAIVRVCSPVTTEFLRGGGVEPFNPDVSSSDIEPGDIWKTAILHTIWKVTE